MRTLSLRGRQAVAISGMPFEIPTSSLTLLLGMTERKNFASLLSGMTASCHCEARSAVAISGMPFEIPTSSLTLLLGMTERKNFASLLLGMTEEELRLRSSPE